MSAIRSARCAIARSTPCAHWAGCPSPGCSSSTMPTAFAAARSPPSSCCWYGSAAASGTTATRLPAALRAAIAGPGAVQPGTAR